MCKANGTTKRSVYENQEALILKHLREHGPITQQEAAMKYGVWRLGARIFNLRRAGWNIISKKRTSGEKAWVAYWLTPYAWGSISGLLPDDQKAR